MNHLRSIGVFVRTAELGSLSAAANALGLTPSAVSKSVASLEKSLKVRLLMRGSRGIALTEEGRRFFERCRAVVGELDAAERELTHSRSTPRGRLRVLLHTTPARFRILPQLPRFLRQYPDLQVEVGISPGARSIEAEGIDVGVFVGDPPDSGVVARRIADLKFVTCASPAYLSRQGTPRHPGELESHNCIEYLRPDGRTRRQWAFERRGESVSIAVRGNLSVNDGQALVDLAAAGEGIAHVIAMTAERQVATGALVALLPEWTSDAPPIHVVYARGTTQSPRVRAFVDFVTPLFADSAPAERPRRRWPMHRG